MTSSQLRKQIIQYCKRLDQKNFVANHDGNISARVNDRFFATPTARAKFDLSESDLIVIDSAGKTKAGTGKIFGEWDFHSEIFKQRPDIQAVVHAHPPQCSALGLSGQALPIEFWPEGLVSLGRSVPCAETREQVGQASRKAAACLVRGNGAFAWGSSLEQAYLRLELVEHLAQIYLLARSTGSLKMLATDLVAQLLEKRKKAGLLSPEELLTTEHFNA
jgi:L-fuculose-phosphate aldolase